MVVRTSIDEFEVMINLPENRDRLLELTDVVAILILRFAVETEHE